jgi:hypothetical protein
MSKLHELLKIYNCLTEPNRFSVLVHARLLVLRQCVVVQYRHERRAWHYLQSPNAHWVR